MVLKASLVVASIVAKYSDIGNHLLCHVYVCEYMCTHMCVCEWCCVFVYL